MKKKLFISCISIFLLFSLAWVLFTYKQIKNVAKEKPPKNVPYLIILGAKVNGKVMSKALYERAITGLHYLKENKGTKVIVTGGQGSDEEIPEAEALRSYLLEHGIPNERIIIEDKSVNTFENLQNAKEFLEIKKAVIVSNDFHLYRSLQLAKSLGIEAYPLAGKTPKIVKTKLYLREYLAILKMKIIGK
ncbi:YdcF family protein [Heyndrickxia oleronia]|jgi:uncharacterized SAM-binding protein YcdF (DUF218 family)|uniref:YdcF family protein n=1 Tax=Heyndrickxia oleronia TaxID=38875 RepID=UPI00242B0DD4|nr:YdcF family protein [Heyndrickxia oleronia]MCI1592255.1 YdcF family protein [Heyndrickxia oleronia]MCI1612007.1 YdcF family protein [Heyndrickxia oleronia]MCI1759716.1 YdcF family protein [Heyndrickxia oleronia]